MASGGRGRHARPPDALVPDDKRLRGRRALKVQVKSAKRRKASSVRWLERQLNDPYAAAARAEGYRARSAYKLAEIDDRFHLLAPGKRVVDLGAAPGGWSQVAAARVRSSEVDRLVVAVDILDVDPIPGVVIVKRDILEAPALDDIRAALNGAHADVVLSDMAASTVGHRQTDHLRTMRLTEAAVDVALALLKPGGDLVAKAFRGGTEKELLAQLKRAFTSVRHVKPPASRAESVELYLVARGLREDASAALAHGGNGVHNG
jgi:23S rRNA (uridine2552-2'-O)-methyltransferase